MAKNKIGEPQDEREGIPAASLHATATDKGPSSWFSISTIESTPAWWSQDNPTDQTATIDLAREAAGRLLSGNTFNDWILVGRGIGVARTKAMLAANTNQPQGSKYAKAFDAELTNAGLEKIAGDKSMRSRLLKIIDHLEEVEAWLQTLPSNKRLEYNHPNTVWRHFSKSTTVPEPSSNIAERQQIVRAMEEENVGLKAKLGEKDKEIEALKSNSTTLMPKYNPKQIFEVLNSNYSEPTLRHLRDLLSKQIDGRAPRRRSGNNARETMS